MLSPTLYSLLPARSLVNGIRIHHPPSRRLHRLYQLNQLNQLYQCRTLLLTFLLLGVRGTGGGRCGRYRYGIDSCWTLAAIVAVQAMFIVQAWFYSDMLAVERFRRKL